MNFRQTYLCAASLFFAGVHQTGESIHMALTRSYAVKINYLFDKELT
jgi:hypothetical protein